MRATALTARVSSTNEISLLKEVVTKSQQIIPASLLFVCSPLALTTFPRLMQSRELPKGIEESSFSKNLELAGYLDEMQGTGKARG